MPVPTLPRLVLTPMSYPPPPPPKRPKVGAPLFRHGSPFTLGQRKRMAARHEELRKRWNAGIDALLAPPPTPPANRHFPEYHLFTRSRMRKLFLAALLLAGLCFAFGCAPEHYVFKRVKPRPEMRGPVKHYRALQRPAAK